MTWVTGAATTPLDYARFWGPDGANGIQSAYAGPATGTASFLAKSSTGPYGPSFWQESSHHGIAAEAAAYAGDWTFEAFVYIVATGNTHLVFSAGGWDGDTTQATNVTALIGINSANKIFCHWESGVSVTVTPSNASSTAMAQATWYHIAVVKDSAAKTLAFYLNGVADGTATYASNPTGGDAAAGTFKCRTGIGPYVNFGHTSNIRISAATLSTTKRNGAWMTASAALKTTTGTLPTDASTWVGLPVILLSEIEQRAVGVAQTSYNDGYDDGYADGYTAGYADGEAAHATDYADGYAAGYADGYADGYAAGLEDGGFGAPIISNISPVDGEIEPGEPGAFSATFKTARLTPITFDLSDIGDGAEITISVKYASYNETYTVRDVEGEWLWPCDVQADNVLTMTGAETASVTMLPRGGWPPTRVEFKVAAAAMAVPA